MNMDKSINNLNEEQFKIFQEIFGKEPVRNSISSISKCSYLREYGFRYWDKDEIERIEKKKDLFNSRISKVEMKILNCEDYEVDIDYDRSWAAYFTFTIEKI